nr:hypothetical protein Iba_chr12eCG7920 [Ipomoea batatas]
MRCFDPFFRTFDALKVAVDASKTLKMRQNTCAKKEEEEATSYALPPSTAAPPSSVPIPSRPRTTTTAVAAAGCRVAMLSYDRRRGPGFQSLHLLFERVDNHRRSSTTAIDNNLQPKPPPRPLPPLLPLPKKCSTMSPHHQLRPTAPAPPFLFGWP